MRQETDVSVLEKSLGYYGPDSLQAVLLYYGETIPEEAIPQLVGITCEGSLDVDLLIQGAKSFGYEAWYKDEASLTDVSQLVGLGVPVIVEWFGGTNAYSVVLDIEEDSVTFMDPETSEHRTMEKEDFLQVWFDFEGAIPEFEDVVVQRIIVVRPE